MKATFPKALRAFCPACIATMHLISSHRSQLDRFIWSTPNKTIWVFRSAFSNSWVSHALEPWFGDCFLGLIWTGTNIGFQSKKTKIYDLTRNARTPPRKTRVWHSTRTQGHSSGSLKKITLSIRVWLDTPMTITCATFGQSTKKVIWALSLLSLHLFPKVFSAFWSLAA